MVKRESRTRVGTNKRKTRRNYFNYTIMLLVLTALVAGAFLLPQIIFRIQDDIVCGNVVLGQRESMDVEMMSTAYEKSLASRMANFAGGLAEKETYYMTAQELEITDEVSDYVYSDAGIYQNIAATFIEGGLLPYNIWEEDYAVSHWKQYVIYSDDYAAGVNVILWYIEMKDDNGSVLKILADAEDGTIYGLKMENGQEIWMDRYGDYLRRYLMYDSMLTELWTYFMVYYEALSAERINDFYVLMEMLGDMDINEYLERKEELATITDGSDMLWLYDLEPETAGYQVEEKNQITFYLPYGDTCLEVGIHVEEPEVQYDYNYIYPDLTVGIRQIYEMIPEFA